jgi:cytochrome P450
VCSGAEDTVSGTPVASELLVLIITVLKTSSSIKTFFLAATLYPEIVRLAQKELDQVIGGDRLPEFSDKPQLPYISAILKEILRWRTPTPFGKLSLVIFVPCVSD